jgi:TolB-like protein
VSTDPGSAEWAEVERLYHAALERAPGDRPAFLAAECADADLRREVDVLLRHEAVATDFLERPAVEDAAAALVASHGPLTAGTRIGDYEVLSLIAAGGMGEVYRARDVRLERDVALKVLPRGTAPGRIDLLRFEEEARAASGLTHPNVVTIYGVGDAGDLAYIAMELVPGITLRDRLATGPLPLGIALDLATQIADAIAAAHEAGIVHRDLKPDNVMVTAEGRIKVLDFGIAKRSHRDASDHGMIRGTAGYMSPEQATGHATDHRTDQFSFGAVCYEMLTGRRAFERDTIEDTIEAVKSAQPEAIHKLNADVPPGVRAVVERCLAKAPDDRWPSSRALADDLRRLRDKWVRDETMRQGRRRVWWLTTAAAVTAAAGFSAWRAWAAGSQPRSLAVLPFENTDGDSEIDYLCDGLAETMMRQLSFVPGLDVRARSTVFNFKHASIAPRDAGRRLGVDAVLAGSVAVKDGRLNVSARLIDVASGSTLWSDHYDHAAADALTIQYELARAIVTDGIRRPLDAEARRRLERPDTTSPAAHDLYLRGLYFHRQGDEAGYLGARRLLQQAVDLDPSFALAQVSLAGTYTVMAVDGYERPNECWPASNRSVRRALDVDQDLPEGHAERSSFQFFYDLDYASAESEWKRAVSARPSPSLPDLLSASAMKLWALGRNAEAIAIARRARTLDPLSPRFAILEADLLLNSGQPAEAAAIFEGVIATHPDESAAHFGLALAYHDQHDVARALAARRRAHELRGELLPPGTRGGDERAWQAIERASAEAELDRLAAKATKDEYVSPLECARLRAQLGDRKGAFNDLDAAAEEHSPGLVFLRADRVWLPFRDDVKFQDVVSTLRMP